MPIIHEEKQAWETSLNDAKQSPDAFNRLNNLANKFYNEHKILLRYDPWAITFHRRIFEALEAISDVHT